MQTAHGLFIPRRERLLVGLETLLAHLHLVVFGYRECLACGTVRASVAAVQMHMRGKGHCRFEVGEASEFGAFYDFGQEEGGAADATDGDGDAQVEDGAAGVRSGPVLMADGASVRLPSGRLVGRKSSTRPLQPPSSRSRRPRQQSPPAVPLESWPSPPQPKEAAVSPDDDPADVSTTRTALTRREKRARAVETMQLARLGASDRSSLAHLSAAQQRALLVTQARQAERGQKEEGRRRARVDRKGNKNLYAYWHTETPVYQCG
jgi:pre-60S factor REI1